jgi:hypothetical protein
MTHPLLPSDPLASDIGNKQWTKAVPPQLHRLMADVDPTFKQDILDIPQAQREPYIKHHCRPDDLWR